MFAFWFILVSYFEHSSTGTRTRVARVRAECPNQLDYSWWCITYYLHGNDFQTPGTQFIIIGNAYNMHCNALLHNGIIAAMRWLLLLRPPCLGKHSALSTTLCRTVSHLLEGLYPQGLQWWIYAGGCVRACSGHHETKIDSVRFCWMAQLWFQCFPNMFVWFALLFVLM